MKRSVNVVVATVYAPTSSVGGGGTRDPPIALGVAPHPPLTPPSPPEICCALWVSWVGGLAAPVSQTLKHIAESFSGSFRRELEANPTRRVLHEGFLTKICGDGKGKHKRYMVRKPPWWGTPFRLCSRACAL
jgi:hypothetical protein